MVDCKIFYVACRINARPLKGKSGTSEKIERDWRVFLALHVHISQLHITIYAFNVFYLVYSLYSSHVCECQGKKATVLKFVCSSSLLSYRNSRYATIICLPYA